VGPESRAAQSIIERAGIQWENGKSKGIGEITTRDDMLTERLECFDGVGEAMCIREVKS
jgi:hypothetical protein